MFGKHIGQKLSAYLHGELSADESRQVAEHLQVCRRCRTEYEDIRFGAQLAAQLVREQAPDSLWEDLEATLPVHRRDAKKAK
ncbi:MAG TPA: zf-HC2 domain-containing protein, partial [Blastocatellia bacterium]|nr:zf-HC2 domain-containing protein [Blastocatellia bacterium]